MVEIQKRVKINVCNKIDLFIANEKLSGKKVVSFSNAVGKLLDNNDLLNEVKKLVVLDQFDDITIDNIKELLLKKD